MISSPYFFGFLFVIYIVLAILNLFVSYRIFKEEKEISNLIDFFVYSSSLNFKILKILFGRKSISNKKNLKLLRVNFISAMIVLIFLIVSIFIKI
ncbi:hypothetical protein ACFPVS_06190 [Neisseria weixii]|uniref:Uncharacterized protein n=1 Tax=Neisseria weixii TaxID=1853276 RepID=A0A3N4NI81_9NEIS|nr:hypothetical protein [Neisseria weixii]ATD64830.1 hypothetical protein CGZ65_05050 [Neisseria weixii]RPD86893.1 hypothetical protein EGK74_07090 [Neisseria weixii]RPD87631.1 hypothetical protein EGK75_06740 [Neisseria weixii]